MIAHHFTHGKRQAQSDGQGQALGNGDHDDSHGINQEVEHEHTIPALRFRALSDPSNHTDDEENDGGANAKVTDEQHETLESLLKRRIARFDDESLENDAPLRARADGDDEHLPGTLRDGGPGENPRVLFSRLCDVNRLARHRGFVRLELAAFDEETIGRHFITGREFNQITDHDLARMHCDALPVANNLDLIVVLDRIQLPELHLLRVIDPCLQENDDDNDDHDGDTLEISVFVAMFLHPGADGERHDARRDQDSHRHVRQSIVTQLEKRLRRRVLELIHPVRLLPLRRIPRIGAQTLLQIAPHGFRHALHPANLLQRLLIALGDPVFELGRVNADTHHDRRVRVSPSRLPSARRSNRPERNQSNQIDPDAFASPLDVDVSRATSTSVGNERPRPPSPRGTRARRSNARARTCADATTRADVGPRSSRARKRGGTR